MQTLGLITTERFDRYRKIFSAVMCYIFFNMLWYYDNLFFDDVSFKPLVILGGIAAFLQFGLLFIKTSSKIRIIRKTFTFITLGIFIYLTGSNPSAFRVIPGYLGYFFIVDLICPDNDQPFIPQEISLPFILILAFSFTYSGITKLMSPDWLHGNALVLLQSNPRLSQWLDVFDFPIWIWKALKYIVVLIETLFFPFYLIPKTRYLAFIFLLVLFLSLFTFMKIYLTLGTIVLFITLLKPENQQRLSNEEL